MVYLNGEQVLKPLSWVGSSREDLKEFPEEIRQDVGFALHGIKTPQQDIDLIKQRLRVAEEDYKENYK